MSQPRAFGDSQRSVNPVLATVPTVRAMAPFTRWAFYAWMFSLPFDVIVPNWLPLEFQGNLSIPRMAGAVLMLCFLIDPSLRPWRLPTAGWAFAAFFGIFTLSMLRSDLTNYVIVLQQFQMLMVFFICYNLFLKERETGGALFSFVVACGVSSVLILTGMAEGNQSEWETQGREYAFGADPNLYSMVLMIGTLSAIGLAHIRKDKRVIRWPVLWGIALLCMLCIAKSGSRGTTLALAVGILTFILRKGSLMVRLRNFVLLTAVSSVACWFLIHTDILRERWAATLETGTTASRDMIFAAAWVMVKEKPLIGWGPAATSELATRLFLRGPGKATHNMGLAILTNSGLAGFLPYLCGYLAVFLAAWRSRTGAENVLPLTIFAALFVTDMVTGGLPDKLHWTFFGYQLAAGQLAVVAARSRAAARAAPPRVARPQTSRG